MTKEIMERHAADNEYLHKDFHGALSVGLDYLAERYGEDSVRDYLRQVGLTYYAPLREQLQKRGLVALQEHFERIYAVEGGSIEIDFSEDEMTMRVAASPAVMHMREHGLSVSPYFVETVRTVNKAICEDSEFSAELVEYDEQTGRSIQKFTCLAHARPIPQGEGETPDTQHPRGECS